MRDMRYVMINAIQGPPSEEALSFVIVLAIGIKL